MILRANAPPLKSPALLQQRAAKSAIIVGAGGGKVFDAARATIDSEFVHNKPFPVAANMVADAIMAADAAGS